MSSSSRKVIFFSPRFQVGFGYSRLLSPSFCTFKQVIVKVLSRESTLIDPGDLHAFPGRRYVGLRTFFRRGRWLFEFPYVENSVASYSLSSECSKGNWTSRCSFSHFWLMTRITSLHMQDWRTAWHRTIALRQRGQREVRVSSK